MHDADVRRVLLLADMLAHLDRADGVELSLPAGQFAVVLPVHLDSVRKALFGDAACDEIALLGRQRDADGAYPVVPCGVQDQRTPATAHVEQSPVAPQVELAADHVEFRGLRIVQRLAVVAVERRRVRHVLVQQQPIELVREVVVVRDCGLVAVAGVQPPGQPRLGHRPFRRRGERAEARGGPDPLARRHPRRRRPRPPHPPRPPQAVGEITLDVDIPVT